MLRFLFSITIWFAASTLSAQPELLKKIDVRNTMEEMLTYHVEYKELMPLLVKRSFKLFIEQFDSQKMYLLQEEVSPYLDLTSSDYELIIDRYYTDEYPKYETLNLVVAKAIQRARAFRHEIIDELITAEELPALSLQEPSHQYLVASSQIKAQIRNQLIRIMQSEQKKQENYWTRDRKQKFLALIDKRLTRFENTYLPGDKKEHYLALHILKSFARSLDAHTAYFSPQEAHDMRASLEKQFEGVGVVLKEGVDGVEIADLIQGGPAARSGQISSGDLLVEIDGKSVVNASYEEILDGLKGNGRKEISLGLKRYEGPGQEKLIRVDLRREKILMEQERLTFEAEPFADGYIGKLTLPSFYESTSATSSEMDLREALKELKRKGKLYGVVLDMRENLGGFLSQAVKVAGLFITSGVVVISKYSQGEVQYLRSIDPRVYFNGPLVILTSKMSASAAEIVAQALQDYGVGLVVGDKRTYGKGTIQFQTVTDDAALSLFKVTVGRYYTVSGRSTQIQGVEADIEVPTQFAPYNIGERYLEYPLPSDQVAAAYHDPLTDIDGQTKLWFQKNYIPYIQKKESIWRQMLSKLENNSKFRIEHDPNFKAFLNQLKAPLESNADGWGEEDLQMIEAVNIVKDMIKIQTAKAA